MSNMVLFCVCKLWCWTSRTCQTGLRSRHFHFKLKIYDLLQTAPLRGANWNRECRLSPHGALRAYTVFPTAVHLRCTLMALSSSVIFSRWRSMCLHLVTYGRKFQAFPDCVVFSQYIFFNEDAKTFCLIFLQNVW